jgi:hypothetical protein
MIPFMELLQIQKQLSSLNFLAAKPVLLFDYQIIAKNLIISL